MKVMNYVAISGGDNKWIRLSTPELINNHIPDWECLARIEKEMAVYNCSFFQNGEISSFFETISQKADKLISSTLTDLLEQLSTQAKQPSGSSKSATH